MPTACTEGDRNAGNHSFGYSPGSSLSFQTSDGQGQGWSQQKEGLGGQQSLVVLKTQLLSVILQGAGQEYSFYGGREHTYYVIKVPVFAKCSVK